MDSQTLNAFIQVAEAESFSLAAERLFLTQPAVSKRVATLEDQLNCKLFDRIGRRVSLTEAGRVLLPKARHIIQLLKDAQQQLADLSGDVSGPLHIATSHHVGLHRLPPTLRAFAQQHPQVELHLSFMDSEKAYQAVQSADVELALITLAPSPVTSIIAQNVWHDPLAFVASPQHPLALKNASKQPLKLHQLLAYSAILPDLNTYTTQIVKGLFDAKGLVLNLNMSTNYLDTIKMMVSVNLGWSVLPSSLIDDGLVALDLPGIALSRELGLIYHQNRTMSNAARAFIETLNPKAVN
ncbi:LysR family transcriptional regulator [Aurantivibrio plasticivorans]